jgi:phage-related protein
MGEREPRYLQVPIVRLFYFYQPNHAIVITHGICKKQQKTDRNDIKLAIQYMEEYLARSR